MQVLFQSKVCVFVLLTVNNATFQFYSKSFFFGFFKPVCKTFTFYRIGLNDYGDKHLRSSLSDMVKHQVLWCVNIISIQEVFRL